MYRKRTNKKRSYRKRSRTNKRKAYKKYRTGGSFLPSSSFLPNSSFLPSGVLLSGVSPERYIPYGGNIVGNLDTPQSTNNIVNGVSIDNMKFTGGKRMKKMRKMTKKNIKQKKIKGGSIFPQQIINSGRGISDFFWDKVNGYQGYQPAPSSSPYTQPIDSTNDISLISLY